MSRISAKLAALATVMAVWLGLPATAAAIEPGFDLFETDPGQTAFAFQDEFTIPPGFFDTGSNAFTGVVHFGGLPLITFQGHDVGDADTVVHRLQPANLQMPFPSSTTIPIEIVSLSLQSVQPIQVQVGQQLQFWDVRVDLSPQRPSQGGMHIVQTADQGGTFDSQLQVFPRFQFTRISDGATRTIDVGQLPLNQEGQRDLILGSANVPWRAGCVPPALAVPGLNDGFCPGLTLTGFKSPNVEQSRLAQHGVVPAQPRLEHYKCYASRILTRFRSGRVSLTDQFGASAPQVIAPFDLCAPVRKNREPLVNRTSHLQCYVLRPQFFQARNVAIRNQFGGDVLRVLRPQSLCIPSLKTPVRQRTPPPARLGRRLTDAYKCYTVRGQAPASRRRLSLRDQFGAEIVVLGRAVALCAPVGVGRVPAQHQIEHLVCYAIRDLNRFAPRVVRVFNRFGTGVFAVLKPRTLCVPSLKLPL